MKSPVDKRQGQSTAGQNPFTEDFAAFVDDLRRQFHVPSISISVVDEDKTYTQPYGEAKVGKVKATDDTLYYIASCTKSFTATTLLSVLAEQSGKPNAVTLKTKIRSILPDDFVLMDEYATAHATLEDALAHVLGVGQHDHNYGGDGFTLQDAVRSLRHLSMTAELREKHQYLNMGYMLIQHVIETLTGKPIEECHQKYIWGPLGMHSTYIRLKDAKASSHVLADGHSWDPQANHLDQTEYVDDYPLVGGGGMVTTIKDFTTYLNAVVHKTLPLDSSWQEELFKPRVVTGPGPYEEASTSLYCLGWGTFFYRGHRVVTHNGGISGFNSLLLFLPDKKWGVAFLSNASPDGSRANSVAAYRLLNDYLGIPGSEREDMVSKKLYELQHSLDDLYATRERLYPNLPNPPLSLTLPLAKYAGTYHNKGYQSITLEVAKPLKDTPVAERTTKVLHATLQRTFNFTLDVEHVSGDFFIAWSDSVRPRITSRAGLQAQFCIASTGAVESFGVNFGSKPQEVDDSMLVWFTKIA